MNHCLIRECDDQREFKDAFVWLTNCEWYVKH